MIKEEEASNNKNQKADDAREELEEEDDAHQKNMMLSKRIRGKKNDPPLNRIRRIRGNPARTHYSDALVKVDEEVKSSDTKTSVGDRVKNKEFVIEFFPDVFILRWVKNEEDGRKAWEEAEMINGEEDDALLNERGESDEEDDSPLNKPGK
ncbi:hypothetical protein YC2023_043890 [Brassica napus]